MKIWLGLLTFFICTVSCGTQPTVLGEWKAARDYDFFHQEWRPAREDVSLILLSDGKYRLIKPGAVDRTGTFTVDQAVEPHRIVLTDDASGTVSRGIYKVDGNKMIMRAADKPGDARFPNSFDPSDDNARLDLIEFLRK